MDDRHLNRERLVVIGLLDGIRPVDGNRDRPLLGVGIGGSSDHAVLDKPIGKRRACGIGRELDLLAVVDGGDGGRRKRVDERLLRDARLDRDARGLDRRDLGLGDRKAVGSQLKDSGARIHAARGRLIFRTGGATRHRIQVRAGLLRNGVALVDEAVGRVGGERRLEHVGAAVLGNAARLDQLARRGLFVPLELVGADDPAQGAAVFGRHVHERLGGQGFAHNGLVDVHVEQHHRVAVDRLEMHVVVRHRKGEL